MNDVAAHGPLLEIRARMARAEAAAGRAVGSVTLVAVSKTFDADTIRPVLVAGQRIFGENRVQEAQAKWPDLRRTFPGTTLHLIGPLQSNKTAEAVALFDVIQTIDRPKIAMSLASECARQGVRRDFYVQVNIGREPQKAGALPEDASGLIGLCRALGLSVVGLMAIPPADQNPEPFFTALCAMARKAGLPRISMGMSGDFEAAIACGATDVRIGSALFGGRPQA